MYDVISSKVEKPAVRISAVVFITMVATLSGLFSSIAAAEEMLRLDDPPVPVSQIRAPGGLTITPGHAEIIRYAQEPGTVIVGDADVVVASIAASDILILTGLQAGVTNVIVLDDDGVQIDQFVLRVALPGSNVIVRRALERQIMRCNPLCAPTEEAAIAVEPTLPVLAPSIAPQTSEATPGPDLSPPLTFNAVTDN